MIVSRRACCLVVNYLSRFSSSGALFENYPFGNKFTDAERERILSTLNSSDAENLSKFNITQTRLKNLINWKKKRGPFTTLSDLLEVDGLGVNILEKLCQSIISDNVDVIKANVDKTKNKNKRNIIAPTLRQDDIDCINSAVGLHIESTGISWAKLKKPKNELTDWHYHDFSELPKKIVPADTFNLAMKIVQELPPADIYVIESRQSSAPGSNPSKSVAPYHQQLELSSMLLALINTNSKLNKCPSTNAVYYLRSRLPARLFGALVGSERVSTETTILNIINGDNQATSLPCSKVVIEQKLVDNYSKCSKGYKDLLEQALLLVISFMDLCVYNNPASHKVINKSRK